MLNLKSNGIEKIIQRLGGKAEQSLITKTYSYLERSKGNSGTIQEEFISKERETEELIKFIDKYKLWFDNTQFSIYLDEGAEQKVFYYEDKGKVLKFNDAIFYVNWTQYLESLLIHNLLFINTKYELVGFLRINSTLYAVVEQPFIEQTEITPISLIRHEMESNGFIVKKNNDYIHNELGLIIEDLHEDNVIINNGVLFFIDTVIYLK